MLLKYQNIAYKSLKYDAPPPSFPQLPHSLFFIFYPVPLSILCNLMLLCIINDIMLCYYYYYYYFALWNVCIILLLIKFEMQTEVSYTLNCCRILCQQISIDQIKIFYLFMARLLGEGDSQKQPIIIIIKL